ncbi:MAG: adenine nucleotide alpha hydrolase [Nitrososphaerota archaeon]|nr:adenine nucleotide alpha hydrolase [Nitrososphaerota archaeon]MDG7042837.1 adenine nucleotide alpha hydrolase [Nitrososphaerota archaeon]MDG7045721.1 adenine nucleotide alpha hydrolase [Nitrososphaerota archaeon]MDG7046358.1 adenine nucleotide alpha hydrolase [Nitrososphaerota archaeon]MDG7048037.1 adenine nucleotide alpha hydrolase [Nitrososphaerota archaeon]
MTKEPIVMSWSGGKDSAMGLYELINSGKFDVKFLLTSVTREYDRISMHGIRTELLKAQASLIGIPLDIAYISSKSSNEEYGRIMKAKLEKYKSYGISKVAFGDIFLRDVREYRERMMAEVGMSCEFPLWGRDTTGLARRFIELGFDSIICTIDPKVMPRNLAGRNFSEALYSFPDEVDPCGERGEFHTFVYKGPIFKKALDVRVGDIVDRDSFVFADVLTEGNAGNNISQKSDK